MGKKHQATTLIEVAAIEEVELDVQKELWEAQIHEVQNSVSTMTFRQEEFHTNMTEVLKTLSSLTTQQAQQVVFQQNDNRRAT
ncbi:hypothetical protein PRUPE_4G222400 [Prunus persica]|uniref:Uncharacterized protein n=1 Tax=Prunus persica TaxID=3760 RepID=A0A251PQU1_PRUPE|nr:hypothetical protein PRUPE_4G222400 [Prunus persica]